MTLDTLIARAAGAKQPAQIIRPPAFVRAAVAREADAGDAQVQLAHAGEKIRTTYIDGWETGFAAGKTLARAAFVNGALSGATVVLAAAGLALACATL